MSDGGLTSGDPLGGGGGAGTSGPGGSVPSGQGTTGGAGGSPGEPDLLRKRETPPPGEPGSLHKRETPAFEAEPQRPAMPGPAPGYGSPVPPGAGGFGHPPVPNTGQLVLAGWWRRAGAAIIDGLIVGLIAAVLFAILGVIFAGAGIFNAGAEPGTGEIAAVVGTVVVFGLVLMVAAFLYAPLLMAKTNGQTLGRMATGIRVVRTNGEPMTFGWAMLREVAVKGLLINTVASGLSLGIATILDYLWPLWDEENRALHDFVVQTRTVLD